MSVVKKVTKTYSTSFSMATKLLSKSIRRDIYNIYGFVRFADEIVDSFHNFNKSELFNSFAEDLDNALLNKISLNQFSIHFNTPITNILLIET